MRNKNQIYYACFVLWILLVGSMGQLRAQSEFDPDSPPEPGFMSVKLTSNPEGCASFEQTNPQGFYAQGSEVTVRVVPTKDYDFVAWTQDNVEVSTNAEYTFTIQKNVRLVAQLQFNPEENPIEPGAGTFNVITTCDPSYGGWIEQSGQGVYQSGNPVKLIVHPSSDYDFVHWEMKGNVVSKDPEYSFTMPSEHAYVKAVFVWNPENPIEPGDEEKKEGELVIENTNPSAGYISQSGSGIYPYQTNVTLSAFPFEGYRFNGWYEGDKLLSSSSSYTYAILKVKSIVKARFSRIPDINKEGELVVVNANPEGGTVTPIGSNTYKLDTEVTLTAVPNENYQFDGWYENETLLSSALSYAYSVTKEKSVVEARFSIKDKIEIGTENGEDGEPHGSVNVEGNVKPGQEIELHAKPNDGFAFEGWYIDGKFVEDAEMDFTYRVKQGVKSIVAKFAELPFILQQEGVAEGITDAWAYVSRLRNNIATLRAKLIKGYDFLGWFRGHTLLSKLLVYQYNISDLRAALPTITAKYAKSTVDNEEISISEKIQVFVKGGQLYLTPFIPVKQVSIYGFNGQLIHQQTSLAVSSSYVIQVPKIPLLIRISTMDNKTYTFKVR